MTKLDVFESLLKGHSSHIIPNILNLIFGYKSNLNHHLKLMSLVRVRLKVHHDTPVSGLEMCYVIYSKPSYQNSCSL